MLREMSKGTKFTIGTVLFILIAIAFVDAIQNRKSRSEPASAVPARIWSAKDRRDYAASLELIFLNVSKMDTQVWTTGDSDRVLNIAYVLMGRVMANEMSKNKDFTDNAKRVGFYTIRYSDTYKFHLVQSL